MDPGTNSQLQNERVEEVVGLLNLDLESENPKLNEVFQKYSTDNGKIALNQWRNLIGEYESSLGVPAKTFAILEKKTQPSFTLPELKGIFDAYQGYKSKFELSMARQDQRHEYAEDMLVSLVEIFQYEIQAWLEENGDGTSISESECKNFLKFLLKTLGLKISSERVAENFGERIKTFLESKKVARDTLKDIYDKKFEENQVEIKSAELFENSRVENRDTIPNEIIMQTVLEWIQDNRDELILMAELRAKRKKTSSKQSLASGSALSSSKDSLTPNPDSDVKSMIKKNITQYEKTIEEIEKHGKDATKMQKLVKALRQQLYDMDHSEEELPSRSERRNPQTARVMIEDDSEMRSQPLRASMSSSKTTDASGVGLLRLSHPTENRRIIEYEKKQGITLNKRRKALEEIFVFYSRQHMMVGRLPTFGDINRQINRMFLGEFFKFINDFQLNIDDLSRRDLTEVFKSSSANFKELHYDDFMNCIETLPQVLNLKAMERSPENYKSVAEYQQMVDDKLCLESIGELRKKLSGYSQAFGSNTDNRQPLSSLKYKVPSETKREEVRRMIEERKKAKLIEEERIKERELDLLKAKRRQNRVPVSYASKSNTYMDRFFARKTRTTSGFHPISDDTLLEEERRRKEKKLAAVKDTEKKKKTEKKTFSLRDIGEAAEGDLPDFKIDELLEESDTDDDSDAEVLKQYNLPVRKHRTKSDTKTLATIDSTGALDTESSDQPKKIDKSNSVKVLQAGETAKPSSKSKNLKNGLQKEITRESLKENEDGKKKRTLPKKFKNSLNVGSSINESIGSEETPMYKDKKTIKQRENLNPSNRLASKGSVMSTNSYNSTRHNPKPHGRSARKSTSNDGAINKARSRISPKNSSSVMEAGGGAFNLQQQQQQMMLLNQMNAMNAMNQMGMNPMAATGMSQAMNGGGGGQSAGNATPAMMQAMMASNAMAMGYMPHFYYTQNILGRADQLSRQQKMKEEQMMKIHENQLKKGLKYHSGSV